MKVNGTIWINWILKILINTTISWFSLTLIVETCGSDWKLRQQAKVFLKVEKVFFCTFLVLKFDVGRDILWVVMVACSCLKGGEDTNTKWRTTRLDSFFFFIPWFSDFIKFPPDHVLNNVEDFLIPFCRLQIQEGMMLGWWWNKMTLRVSWDSNGKKQKKNFVEIYFWEFEWRFRRVLSSLYHVAYQREMIF